jgi:hypothetical protein
MSIRRVVVVAAVAALAGAATSALSLASGAGRSASTQRCFDTGHLLRGQRLVEVGFQIGLAERVSHWCLGVPQCGLSSSFAL